MGQEPPKVEGVVMRTLDSEESHQIVDILNLDYGKLPGCASGARKS